MSQKKLDPLSHWNPSKYCGLRIWLLIIVSSLGMLTMCWLFYICLISDGSISLLETAALVIYGILVWKNILDLILMILGFLTWFFKCGPCHPLEKLMPYETREHGKLKKMAVLLFVRHEDRSVYEHSLESIANSLLESGMGKDNIDIFLLSDSVIEHFIEEEEKVRDLWNDKLSPHHISVFHRVRTEHTAAKYGNFVDFIERWGDNYEYAIPLDADGAVSGHNVRDMVALMDRKPDIALMQTVPHIRDPETLYGLCHAYAGNTYGALTALGYAWLNPDRGFYWGHNSVIRVQAIADVKLPHEVGIGFPNKGKMTSHDLVEGVLLSAAGWRCMLVAGDTIDAFESAPIGALETLQRDARWCGGDLFNSVVFMPLDNIPIEARFILITSVYSYAANFFLLCWILMTLWMFVMNTDYLSTYVEIDDGTIVSHIASEPWIMLIFVGFFILVPKMIGLFMHTVSNKKNGIALFFGDLIMGIVVSPVLAYRLGIIFVKAWFGAKPWGSSPRDASEIVPFKEMLRDTKYSVIIGASGIAFSIQSEHDMVWIAQLFFISLLIAPITFYILRLPLKKWKDVKKILW